MIWVKVNEYCLAMRKEVGGNRGNDINEDLFLECGIQDCPWDDVFFWLHGCMILHDCIWQVTSLEYCFMDSGRSSCVKLD